MLIQLPRIKMDYLRTLTDDTGVFQHAKLCIPKRNEGYTTDDNARALIACTRYYRLKKDTNMEGLANVYLAFLYHMQKPEGAFHNYLSYSRGFLDVDGSEEANGRALWSCGCVINSSLPKLIRLVAKDIFDRGLPWVWKSTWLRYYASTIFGLTNYYRTVQDENLKISLKKLADLMTQRFEDEARENWYWFEPQLTYDNARLPQALFQAYSILGERKYLDVAKESMDFLVTTQMVNDVFMPIGNDGWYKRGGSRPFYDQQPLEAAAMVDAAVEAFYATNDQSYLQLANRSFEWFLGRNSRGEQMYCLETGGCYDGLNTDTINMNQGAESSISYLMARLKLEEVNRGIWKRKNAL
jgi:hypothetical protein